MPRIVGAGFLGLLQRSGQDVGREAFDLGVELQGGDEVAGTGDLEVHVAEGVLGTEDVGEGGVLAVLVDEAHGDAGDGRLDGHAAVHERQRRGADRRHRGRAVGGQDLGDEAERVGPLLHVGDHRQQGALGEQAVADLAALGAAHAAGLAVGVRRHVVVVHVALLLLRPEVVQELVHLRHAEGEDVEHLGLAPLEQAGAVGGVEDADLGGDRAEVRRATTVDADALVDDARADDLLEHRLDGAADLLLAAGELVGQLGADGVLERRARPARARP